MSEEQEQPTYKMNKTRKAVDWLCACLIRLPIVLPALAILISIGLGIAYMVNPEAVIQLIQIFK